MNKMPKIRATYKPHQGFYIQYEVKGVRYVLVRSGKLVISHEVELPEDTLFFDRPEHVMAKVKEVQRGIEAKARSKTKRKES